MLNFKYSAVSESEQGPGEAPTGTAPDVLDIDQAAFLRMIVESLHERFL